MLSNVSIKRALECVNAARLKLRGLKELILVICEALQPSANTPHSIDVEGEINSAVR